MPQTRRPKLTRAPRYENKALGTIAEPPAGAPLQEFCFTEFGVTIKATGREEAEAKLKKLLNGEKI